MRKVIAIGKASSAITTAIAVVYAILLLLCGLQLIPYPANLYWFFLPSFLLAPAFLITSVCIDILAPDRSRKWTIPAWALATINCTMIIMVYGAKPGGLKLSRFDWETGELGMLIFEHRSLLITVKYAGVFLLSASTLLLAFGFRNSSVRWLYRSLLINGLLLPLLILSCIFPQYYYLAFTGTITFPFAMLQVRKFFIIKQRKLEKKKTENTSAVQWLIQ